MFTSYGISLPETSASAIFLDSPLLTGPQLDLVLERKRLELRRLSQRLHGTHAFPRLSVPIIRNVLIAPSIMHTFSGLRFAPTAPSCRYMMACYVSHSSRISTYDLDDHRWSYALHAACDMERVWYPQSCFAGTSAYMASAVSTAELASSLLRIRLREVVDSGVHGNCHVGLDHAC
jgi:hypothetical protein